VFFVTVVGSAWIAKLDAPAVDRVLGIAVLTVLGTLACAAIGARATPFPKGAYWGTVGLMSGVVMLSAVGTPPERWLSDTRNMLWMLPWFFLIFASVPAARSGACTVTGPRAGWLLMGTGMIYSACLVIPAWVRL
jgi:hypothetical protein